MKSEEQKKRFQIDNKLNSLKEVIAEVPQGSIDSPLLFSVFINDIFLFICVSFLNNYADDNNLSTTKTNIRLMNQMLLSDFRTVNNWFMKTL